MTITPAHALIALALVIFGAAAVYTVRRTGTTAGIAEIGKALGSLVAELVNALNRLP